MRGPKAALLPLVAVLALVLSPSLGFAKDPKELKKGIAAYNDLEYENAVKLLNAALKKKLDKKGQLDAYRYLALSYLALDKKDDARAAFRKIIEIEPTYTLPSIDSPVAIELFEQEKKALQGGPPEPEPEKPPPPPEKPPVTAVTAPAKGEASVANPHLEAAPTPASPGEGQTVTVTLTVLPADVAVDSVTLSHRVQGKGSGFSTVRGELQGGGKWAATIPGTFVTGPAIEYYAVALDEDGLARAMAGSRTEPLVMPVGGEPPPTGGAPFYSKWWFWAGVGGVLVAGAAVGIVLATGGDDGGGGETGFVDVTILPPP